MFNITVQCTQCHDITDYQEIDPIKIGINTDKFGCLTCESSIKIINCVRID